MASETQGIRTRISDAIDISAGSGSVTRIVIGVIVLWLVVVAILGFLWDKEPEMFDVIDTTDEMVSSHNVNRVTGSATVATMIRLADSLLTKRGGYLSNDVVPPGPWMDNIPEWEFGVLVQIRDMARTMRNNLSRSQSQSQEDQDLVNAENQFYFDNESWMLPDTEGEYRKGIRAMESYLIRLGDTSQQDAQFYARADNLRIWLSEVETRLGSLSQRLSASVGKRQLDTNLAGDAAARQSTSTAEESEVKTPWMQIDNVFYEARGTTWALLHLLRAIEVDFRDVLEKKNALVSLQQIIRELEPTQDPVWSPMIMNGEGFGLAANHSLVMASHISRANAAIIDLRRLLEQG